MVRIANRPVLDEQGYATGILKNVNLGEGTRIEKKGRNVDHTKYDRYEFTFEIEGKTGEPLEIKLHTGTVLNDEPVKILAKTRGKKEQQKIYNRFTSICLSLGVISIGELERSDITTSKLEDIELQLKNLHELPVKVKMGKNDEGYWVVDPQNITKLL